jgi:hypothetical protein
MGHSSLACRGNHLRSASSAANMLAAKIIAKTAISQAAHAKVILVGLTPASRSASRTPASFSAPSSPSRSSLPGLKVVRTSSRQPRSLLTGDDAFAVSKPDRPANRSAASSGPSPPAAVSMAGDGVRQSSNATLWKSSSFELQKSLGRRSPHGLEL